MSTKKDTSVEYKCVRHIERLKNPKFKVKSNFIPEEHYNFSVENVVDDTTNRVVKKMVKKLDNTDPHKHLKVSDFSLENLQASGAISHILPCSLVHDNHTIVNSLTKSAENIINSSETE